jgi:hypothetical protein
VYIWLLGVLLNTRDLFTTGCCLRPVAMTDLNYTECSPYELNFARVQRASYDGLHAVYIPGILGVSFLKLLQIALVTSPEKLLEHFAWYSGTFTDVHSRPPPY